MSRASIRPWSGSAPRRAAPGRDRARPRPRRSGTALRERIGATDFLGYETETAEGVIRRDRQGRRRSRAPRGGRKGFARPQPDAVLRRVGRAGRRRRRDQRARLPRRGHRHAQEARRPHRPRRLDRRGDGAARHGGRTRRRPRRPLGHPRQPFGDPHPARGAAARARRPCGAEGLARLARPAALRLRPSEAGHAGGDSPRSRTSPTAWCSRTPR